MAYSVQISSPFFPMSVLSKFAAPTPEEVKAGQNYNNSITQFRHYCSKCLTDLLPSDVGYLYNFTVQTAHSTPSGAIEPANWVEQCKCPDAFVGQFCESCSPGFRRTLRFGGPLAKCIPCECHGHSDSCDSESGRLSIIN